MKSSRGVYLLKYLLGCVVVLCSAFSALAQSDVSFTVRAPKQVIEGNKFAVTYVLKNADGSDLKYDSPDGITKLFGPATSTSQNYSMINGKTSSSKTVEYTITYRAYKAGKYTIPSASIVVDGSTMKTNPFAIEVLEQDKAAANNNPQSQSSQNGNPNQQFAQGSGVREIQKDDIFIRIQLSKSSIYEQEAVVCTIKLYTKFQVSGLMPKVQPTFDGCLIEDIPASSNLNEMEHYNGYNYMIAELKKCILYPQKSGELTINSGVYDVTVTQFNRIPRAPFGYITVPVDTKTTVKSNQVTVNVKALPEPRPAGFAGAVGNFTVTTDMNSSSFRTGEAATLNYNIKGTGNIKYLRNPVVEFPTQFDVYDPQSNIDARASGGNVTGTDVINYTFVPLYAGDYVIEGVPFIYFNPSKGEYVTIETPDYNISVKHGAANYDNGASAQSSVKKQNTDIRHIFVGDMALSRNHSVYVVSALYWLWYIIPIMLLAAVLVIYRKTIKERANIQMMRTKKAGKVAKRKLKQAKVYMLAKDSSRFYEEVLNAMWGYISDKLGIPVSMLSKENVAAELAAYGADEILVQNVLSLLDNCEFAQYAPQGGDSTLEDVYNEVSDVMNKIEGVKRK